MQKKVSVKGMAARLDATNSTVTLISIGISYYKERPELSKGCLRNGYFYV